MSSDTMYSLISFRKSTLHKNVNLIIQSVIVNNKLTILLGGDFLKLIDKYIL